jgi:hypothetical protein
MDHPQLREHHDPEAVQEMKPYPSVEQHPPLEQYPGANKNQ